MSKVSRLALRKEVLEAIQQIFLESFAEVKDRKELAELLNELLSPQERLMMAKRVACALLLYKGREYLEIQNLLKLSSPTIARINSVVRYKDGALVALVKKIVSRQTKEVSKEEFIDLFDTPKKGDLLGSVIRSAKRRRKIRKITESF